MNLLAKIKRAHRLVTDITLMHQQAWVTSVVEPAWSLIGLQISHWII